MASTADLIRTAVERFQAEVPALQKLKLVFGLELKAHHDIQLYRVELPGFGLASVGLEDGLAEADLAAIVTAHPGVDYERVVATAPRVLDFRGITRGIEADNLERL